MMVETTLEPETASPALARRFVADYLSSQQLAQLVDVAALLVTELVTNAVLHSGSRVLLSVRANGRVRVEVHDDSPARPVLRHFDEGATTGRGLLLVETLADRWGTEPHNRGKTVWFELLRQEAA